MKHGECCSRRCTHHAKFPMQATTGTLVLGFFHKVPDFLAWKVSFFYAFHGMYVHGFHGARVEYLFARWWQWMMVHNV